MEGNWRAPRPTKHSLVQLRGCAKEGGLILLKQRALFRGLRELQNTGDARSISAGIVDSETH
jgi:hypothetical protein